MLRTLSVLAGVAILSSLTFIQVMTNGGLAATTTPLTISVGIGLIVGSVAIAKALKLKLRGLAVLLILCMVSAEIFVVLTSGERLVTTRDQISAPRAQQAKEREKEMKRYTEAVTAKQKADEALVAKSAESGCRVECSKLLLANVKSATEELNSTREQINKLPREELSASPLADRLSLSHTTFDLIMASLYSFSGTLLGSTLIAFGTSAITRSEREEVALFLTSVLAPDASASVTQPALEAAYSKWCVLMKLEPLDYLTFTEHVSTLLASANLEMSGKTVLGVSLKML
jgi:hypothetical protein